MMLELEGKTALVTGASRGIGAAIAERFASAGAHVIITARKIGDEHDPEGRTLWDVVSRIRSRGGKADPIACDLGDAESRLALIQAVRERFGDIDILINNAARGSYGTLTQDLSDRNFRKVFEINVFGPHELMIAFLPGMQKQGRGWIVNISSSTGDRSAPNPDGPPFLDWHQSSGVTTYSASKAALNYLSRGLAAELYSKGIAVNTLAPVNSVITEATQDLIDRGLVPQDRVKAPESPETMAEAALALSVVDPSVTTGRVLYSGQYLEEIGREVRGRDGEPFDAMVTTAPVKY
jgi:citronellol/citronellal dehydrogenase